MALFSQRKGIKPLKKEFQREEIDTELRNRLWSALQLVIWNKHDSGYRLDIEEIDLLLDVFWLHFFKLPLDTRPSFTGGYHQEKSAYSFLREFFFTRQWYDVFDFLEFVIKHVPKKWADELRDFCNG